MRSVDSEVLVKIVDTLHELTSTSCPDESEDEERLSFLFLEEELKIRGIRNLTQLPIGGGKTVVQFANSLPADTRLFSVLQKLEFTECLPFPVCSGFADKKVGVRSRTRLIYYSPYLTGTGYQNLSDQSTHQDGIYDLGDLIYPSFIGFALPQHMKCSRIGKIYNIFRVFRSTSHYASFRHQELNLPLLSANGVKWKAEPKLGYNIGHTKSYGDIAFTFVREYRQFSLYLNSHSQGPIPLHPTFVQKLKEVTADIHLRQDQDVYEQWTAFFNIYGTHVVTSANGGGRVVLTILENHLKNYFGVNDLSQPEKVREIEQVLSHVLDMDEKDKVPTRQATPFGVEVRELLLSSIRLHGGDPSFENLDLTMCHRPGEIKEVIFKWSQTLPSFPIMLESTITVEPLVNILMKHGMTEESRLLDLATVKLFGKSFYRSSSEGTKNEGRGWGRSFWSTNSK